MPRHSRIYLILFLVVLAPIGAMVILSALLLFGVEPRWVFAPGRAIKALIEAGGIHVHNRVAVAGTGAFWWAVIAAAGLAWERRRVTA